MMVAVISSTGVKLMPTSCQKARKLINKGKAEIFRYKPFTIKLTQREIGDVQPIEYCCDTGYQHIGISIKSAKHEYVGVQVEPLSDEPLKHQAQGMYRRTRRNRKTRYRKARFDNRAIPKGWFAPSIVHKKDIHTQWAKRYMEVMPITSIIFEAGEFDTQLLKALAEGKPAPQGKDYQNGSKAGFDNVRNAVFARDNYTCQCCGKSALTHKGLILHVHHVHKYKSEGGPDTMDNLATICHECHTPANHKEPDGKLWKMKNKWKAPSFKGASFMTSVRWIMYDELKESFPDIDVHLTYGSDTKLSRRKLQSLKSHIGDAWAMGEYHPKHKNQRYIYKKQRRNNRVLALKFVDAKYIDLRDGKEKYGKELFNGRIKRNHKLDGENLSVYRARKTQKGYTSIRRQHYPYNTGDIIFYKGKKGSVSGTQNKGKYVAYIPEGFTGKNKPLAKWQDIQIIKYCSGYLQPVRCRC